MVVKTILILLSMTVSFIEPEPTKIVDQLHCYYSRYIHCYFKQNADYFKKTFEKKPDGKLNAEQLLKYGDSVKSYGKVVMAMLDELRYANKNKNDHYPKGLLAANLYLNNIYNTVHIGIVENIPGASSLNENVYFKNGYYAYINYIENSLLKFIKENCKGDVQKTHSREEIQIDHRLKALDKLMPTKYNVISMKWKNILQTLQENLPQLDKTFHSTLARGTYSDFHPSNMLFQRLLSIENDDETVNRNLTVSNNKIHLLRDVLTNWRFQNRNQAKISDLYVHMKTQFQPGLVQFFQRQVLVAALHPVFMRSTTYIHLIDKVFYPGKNKVDDVDTRISTYQSEINSLGETLLGSIHELIDLKLFPTSLQKYLYDFLKKMSDMIKFPQKEYLQLITKQWIQWLLKLCSSLMEHMELEFYNQTELFEIDTNGKVKELIEITKQDIQDLCQYVKTLEQYKEAFHVVTRTIHDQDLFSITPIDPLNNFLVRAITTFVGEPKSVRE